MTKYTTVIADLLRPLSRSDFQKAISGYKADYKVRSFDTYKLFMSMIFGMVTGCFSVREIEKTSMNVNKKRLYHAGLEAIKRSTFCDGLEKRNHGVFQSVFHSVVDIAQSIGSKMQKKFKDPLRIIDATTLSLCIKKFNWAKYRTTKGAVKVHMNLDGDNIMPFDACITNGNIHDVQKLHNFTQETGVIYALDRGYVDYKSLYNIDLRGSFFVSRMKSNGTYKIVKDNSCTEGGPVLSDVHIELTGALTKKSYPKPFRKIKYYDAETKRTYEFITNDMEREAIEIAMIYKERWQVELFFKWIKQHLKIKSFWGTSENAVYSQIWVALILSILIWINKTLHGIEASAHDIFIRIKSTLLTKNSLIGLYTNIPDPKPPDESFQPLLEGFKC